MRNIFKNTLWLLPAATLLFTSCDDFLDKLPENKVDQEKVDYTDISSMYMPVSGVYGILRQDGTHWMVHALHMQRDPDVWSGRTDDQAVLIDFNKYHYDKSFWGLNETFRVYYNIIMKANSALEALDQYATNITDSNDYANYKNYSAEVRFLRAFAYYRLIDGFGKAPLLTSNTQIDIPLKKKGSVENYILGELAYCSSNLPAVNPASNTHAGAVTKYTAQHLKAKVHLNRGEYDQVKSYTDSIINSNQFELYSDFYNLFKIPGKLSKESLFEIQTTDFGTGSGDVITTNCWFVYQNCGNMGGWGFGAINDDAIAFANGRGEKIRALTTFLVPGSTTPDGDQINQTSTHNSYLGKMYTPKNQLTPGRTEAGVNNNVRIFRYADVLLMNAEAKVRLGENGDAPLNLVRQRADLPLVTNATVDQILDERRMEFMSEWGEYYSDIVRTQRWSLLPSTFTQDATYYPIPQGQIDLNPKFGEPAID